MELGPNQTLWVDALESGKYEQGKKHLNKDGKLCCLGVACELFEVLKGKIHPNSGQCYVDENGYDYAYNAPSIIVSKLGLRSADGHTIDGEALVEMNDGGKSFIEIAKFIKENPQLVFNKSV